MSTFAAESKLCQQIAAAKATEQNAKAAAFNTYGFVQANYAAYLTALVLADTNFTTSLNAACSAAGVMPSAVDKGLVPHAYWAKVGGL